jgi:hypothetical protein
VSSKRREVTRRAWPVPLVALTLLAACGGKKPDKPAAPALVVKQAPAVLVGSVRLAPGQELPKFDPEMMERRVLQHVKNGTFPEMCTPPKLVDREPVHLTTDGKLTGVMLAASEFTHKNSDPPAKVHELTISDCRLSPTMVVARLGDMLRVKNEVKFPFMPGLSSQTFNQVVQGGEVHDFPLDKLGVQAFSCGFTAPCGRTDVVVLAHSYSAVTDAKGEFRFEDFPADETVQLHAWHPLFSDSMISVKVMHGEEKRVELVLTPAPPPPAKKPETPHKPGEVPD